MVAVAVCGAVCAAAVAVTADDPVTSKDSFFPVHELDDHSVVKRTAQRFAQRARPATAGAVPGVKTSFSLQDIVKNEFSAERWNGTWVSDDEFAYRYQKLSK